MLQSAIRYVVAMQSPCARPCASGHAQEARYGRLRVAGHRPHHVKRMGITRFALWLLRRYALRCALCCAPCPHDRRAVTAVRPRRPGVSLLYPTPLRVLPPTPPHASGGEPQVSSSF